MNGRAIATVTAWALFLTFCAACWTALIVGVMAVILN